MSKPFIKWAGGKRQLLPEIRKKYNDEKLNKCTKYCEPFLGGGAVFFDIIKEKKFEKVLLNDLTEELMIVYTCIKENMELLIEKLEILENEYIDKDLEEKKEIFYKKREIYNSLLRNNDNKLEIASLFIFLNRTCFNGLYRVNSYGKFNVPIGSYKRPKICDRENLLKVSKDLENVILKNNDYSKTLEFIDENTIVYIDPPYRPLNKTSSFNSYHKNIFDDKEQIKLADFCKKASNKGAFLIISNSDPKNTDKKDDFFENIYDGFKIERVMAKRYINSKTSGRKELSELLITNF